MTPLRVNCVEVAQWRRSRVSTATGARHTAGRHDDGMELRYLYVGSSDIGADLAEWLGLPSAILRWRFRHFGADVAAIDLGAQPRVLLADHRPPGSVLPIYAVEDLASTSEALCAGGWRLDAGPMGTPEGLASVLRSAGGGSIALLKVDRPDAMDHAYHDATNEHAVR